VQPLLKVFLLKLLLRASFEDLDVRPVEYLELLFEHGFVKSLGDEQRVPFLGCAIGTVFLSVGSRDVNFLLGAGKRVHLEG